MHRVYHEKAQQSKSSCSDLGLNPDSPTSHVTLHVHINLPKLLQAHLVGCQGDEHEVNSGDVLSTEPQTIQPKLLKTVAWDHLTECGVCEKVGICKVLKDGMTEN